jgi:allantoinase
MFDLVVRAGTVVTPEGIVTTDIGVEDGRIAAVGPELGGGAHEIVATGCVVLPGLIDIHLHFNEPGRTDWEGAGTGSRALAAGGGTLFFDMPLNSTPCTVNAREFDRKAEALAVSSLTDFGLWGGIIPGNRGDLAEVAERGAVGFKAFLCNSGLPEFPRADDLTLYEGMREAARLGLPVAVHAESEEITAGLTARLARAGRCDIEAFLESRPVIAETEAIARAGLIAREAHCKLHIVHISSGRGVAAALEARALGTDISIETCPHYLLFTEDDLRRIGALAKCAPPLRSQRERDALWNAVRNGEVDVIASDHSPCPPALKQGDNFFSIWGGIAGVQWTLPALLSALPLDRVAALTAGFGARRFGIPNKGAVAPGFDADLVIVDVNAFQTVTKEKLIHRHAISPYIGREMRGVVRATIRRGETIYDEGRFPACAPGRLIRPSFVRLSFEKGHDAASVAHAQQLPA